MDAVTANWAGNVVYGAARVHRPSTVEQLAEIVANSPRLRPLGTRHAFNRLADTDGDLVSVAGLPRDIDIDTAGATARVAAGLPYGEVAERLHAAGYALPTLASLPHISVAGACATGTHGSGDRNGGLATSVSALELVRADGAVATLSRAADGDRFQGSVVALGALGVVTAVTLDLLPTFDVRQVVYEGLPLAALAEHWDEIFSAGHSVSLFTRWVGPRIDQVWVKRRVDAAPASAQPVWLGATRADGPRHPVPGMPAERCTEQLDRPGPWHTRLPHFRADAVPSSGDELQSELLLPRAHGVAAVAAIAEIGERIAPVLHISEIRTVAADALWLSPAYGRDSVAIHFTWHSDAAAVAPVLAAVEERLAPYGARPHWGKLFGHRRDVLRGLYERYDDFARLRRADDPHGRFGNPMLDHLFGA